VTPDRTDQTPPEPDENGVLSDTGSINTTGIGIIPGATAQVNVSLTPTDEDDLEDDVVDDGLSPAEVAAFVGDGVGDSDEVEEVPTGEIVLDTGAVEQHPLAEDDDVVAAEEVVDEVDDEPAMPAVEVHEPVVDVEPEAPAEPEAHVAAAAADSAEPPATATEPEVEADPAPVVVPAASVPRTTSQRPQPVASRPAREEPVRIWRSVPKAAPVEDVPAPEVEAPASEEVTVDTPDEHEGSRVPEPHPVTGSLPATRREAHLTDVPDRTHEVERVHTPRPEMALTSKRIGEFEPDRESPDLLTADRLLDHRQIAGPEPEGAWQHFVFSISGGRINLGDGKRARQRKELARRIDAPLAGGARFVPVLSRKGGVGKTTVTTLLGMALADARDDRIIAIDANPDRGTLAERIARPSGRTVRDLVRTRDDVHGYNDISTIVARDETRLDVLASDSDPRVSEAFSDLDYEEVATLAAHYYSIVLTDTGTGIVHSVMGATLGLADELVIVSGLSVDEARLASETLTWLETNGYAEQVRNAVVVLNNSRPGAPLVRQNELEAHFRTRVRSVVRIPYDPHIATGSAITFHELQPETRHAARELAATVVEGLRALAAAA
jgi:MinD-like ATPase involved in chromosome partitioning or flagellar assembly